MRHHTRFQRVGVQSNNPLPEKPEITAQDSYLGVTPYLAPLLFLDLPRKVTESGRNLDLKTSRNPI
ncbi:unnamed protein product [Prunus brigantina]